MAGVKLSREAEAMGAPPHWLAYVGTPDVDATTKRAGELGATVLVPPADIPTVGRFAVLQDPRGAVFAAFTPGIEQDPETAPGLGDFSWHELATTDHEAAFAFYSALFGWEKTSAMDMGPDGVYQMYGRNGRVYGGVYDKRQDVPGPPAWVGYIHVEDVHSTSDKVKAHGGQVINGPMEVPDGSWIANCIDPQGAVFAVHHTAPTS